MVVAGMAARNLGRNRRRTALAALSVFMATAMIIVLAGLMDGFLDSMVKNYTKNESGHVSIATEGRRARERFMPASEYLTNPGEIESLIASIPGLDLRSTARRIRFGVMLSAGGATKTALCVAGDPEAEKGLLMLDRSLLPGSSYITEPGQAILGAGLAASLGLKAGDELRVVAEKADYGLGFKKFQIAGVFATGVNDVDGALFQVGLADAASLLGMEGGCHEILVMLDDYRRADEAAIAIAAALSAAGVQGLSVRSWTASGDYPKLIAMVESMYFWLLLFVAFLGCFIVANVTTMVVLERRKEIGILGSMGMDRRAILLLFLAEGAMTGAIGAFAGSMAGLCFNAYYAMAGFDFSAALKGFAWPIDNVIYPSADPVQALFWVFMGTLVAAIMAYLPARRAARMSPVEAIRAAY